MFNRETKDHVIPISKGGDNTKENIVPACQSCNSKKFNKIF
ncbi:MAG: HNH endonuclease [Bacteroidales bacterium]|nr:HNH endonuclease [Bacteroidales bacterium]